MDERYDAEQPESKRLKFHTQTAGQSLTAQQPLNNIVRVTIQALGGVLGGTQSLHTNSFDEALALPSEKAVRVALRTQQIIADESGAADIVDPMGGSFAIEKLTNEMEAEILSYIEEIEEIGNGSIRDGVLAGIDQGTSSARSVRRVTSTNSASNTARKSSSASTSSPSRRTPRRIPSRSTKRLVSVNSTGSSVSKTNATTRKSTRRCRRCLTPSKTRKTSCRTSLTR